MKHAFFLFAFALAASGIFVGCKENSTNSGGGIPGTMIGYVSVHDASGTAISDNSGVKVTIDGTSYSALTDYRGKWELDNVNPGTYNISCTKDGYSMAKVIAHSFAGNGTDYIAPQSVYQILKTYAMLVLRPFDSTGTAVFSSRIYRNDPNESLSGFDVLYFGKDSVFNPFNPQSYLYTQLWKPNNLTNPLQDYQIQISDLAAAGFSPNDKIYCTAFATNVTANIWDIENQKTIFIASYLDIQTNRMVYTAFENNSHSEVKSFILP